MVNGSASLDFGSCYMSSFVEVDDKSSGPEEFLAISYSGEVSTLKRVSQVSLLFRHSCSNFEEPEDKMRK